MKDLSTSSAVVSLKSVTTIPVPKDRTFKAITLSCFYCPNVLGNTELLSSIKIEPNSFSPIALVGVTDTLLSRGAKKALPGLGIKMKHIVNNHPVERVILLVHKDCEHDFVINRPKSAKAALKFRIDQVMQSTQHLKVWVPSSVDGIEIESYFIQPYQGALKVKQLIAKPPV